MAINQDVHLSISPAHQRDRLLKNIANHVADLTVALTTLNNGQYTEQANTKPPNAVFHVQYTGVNVEEGAQRRQIQNCFLSLVNSYITYLDELIGVLKFAARPLLIDRTLTGGPEITAYAQGKLDECISRVASDRSLTNPKKIGSFPGLSQWATDVSLGMFALRRCFVHHDGVATEKITLSYRTMIITAGGREVTALPTMLAEGEALALTAKDHLIEFNQGDKPELTEEQLRGIVTTIQQWLSLETLEIASKELSKVIGTP